MNILDNYEFLDLELGAICDLKCPMCTRNLKSNSSLKICIRKIDDIVSQIKLFKNLKVVYICGDKSEPLLYPNILELIYKLKKIKFRFKSFYKWF